ncbi:MAG TPA: efflux RND transporter periplasmic adaptor subunit [Polyangiaceae bacterium]|nr:efflux RND transporter periplasmic adaptor subunit [Polyangiaceae bacterium]
MVFLWLTAVSCDKPAPAQAPPAKEVEVITVTKSELRDTGEYLGTVISRQSVNLVPQIAGYVRRIAVRPGQVVKAGDPILEVDARQESAALESAQAQQRSAEANQQLAARTLERSQALLKEGVTSAQELERAEAEAEAAEQARKAAEALVSQRRVGLQYFAVRAPLAGVLGDVQVRIGDFVTASTPLTSITQSNVLEVSTTVPADRARSILPGTPLELLDVDGKVLLMAPVYFVAPQADPRTQLVDVLAIFENSVGLRPQEIVRTRVIYGTSTALQVPVLSIVRQSGQPFVFAVTQKGAGLVVSRRPVTLGRLGEQSYVVEGGLTPGDRIAVSSLQALRDGAPIRIKAEAPTAKAEQGKPAAPAPLRE